MRVFIAVVSHNHGELIKKLGCLIDLARDYRVIINDNIHEEALEQYCLLNNITYIYNSSPKGFGENNNVIYEYCTTEFKMNDDDLFIILNPDVIIKNTSINQLANKMVESNINFSTINLYLDSSFSKSDLCIRRYPKFIDFVNGFLGRNKTIINKRDIVNTTKIDWAAGSFLAIKSKYFKMVNGFNTRYFMYCEDIDLCMRLKYSGCDLHFIPDIKAVHLAGHRSKKIFSKHFYWHMKSIFIYILEKRKYVN
ncbi:glycosyltransferase family 2 protein [Edwardsiella tarda]|uniref:glycosyltransferase family 2 protein n=1 Tax=Edwardsiella tarda TaxID=636 RepID=UPI00351C2039